MNTKGKNNAEEKEWRRLCNLVLAESDPARISELVDQLLKELDKSRQTATPTNGRSSSGARDN
jgi:hypothetical protein